MMETVKYQSSKKHTTISKGHLYRGDNRLVVWLDGGSCQSPLSSGLGKALSLGTIQPTCSVLCVVVSCATANIIRTEELMDFIHQLGEWESVSIVGWSNGADAAARIVAESPNEWHRVCLISNYTKQFDKNPSAIKMPLRMLVGSAEASGSVRRDWKIIDRLPDAKLFRVPPYDHMIGQKIWTDFRWDVLGWLCGDKDEVIK